VVELSKKEEVVVSRVYKIPLTKAWVGPRHRMSPRVIKLIKEFAFRHMKGEEVKLDPEVNRLVWARGIRNPPRSITVLMEKSKGDVVKVHLPEKVEKPAELPAEQSETSSGRSSESDSRTSGPEGS